MTKFYKRIACPASGKTYGAIQYMVDCIRNNGSRFVVSAISVDLCLQIEQDFPEAIKVNTLITDTVKYKERVRDKYKEALEDKEDDVIIVTHSTLLGSYGMVDGEGWDIVVDELPNIHSCRNLKIPSIEDDSLSRWLTPVEPEEQVHGFTPMGLRYGFDSKLQSHLDRFEDVRDEESLLHKASIEGLNGVLSGETQILRKQEETPDGVVVEYAFNNILDPYKLFNNFNEVIFLCAEFDKQLTGLIFKYKYNIEVVEKQEISLRKTYYEKPERIKIYPLIKAPKTFSRNLSESWYCLNSKQKRNKHGYKYPSYVEFFEHLVDVASKIVGDEGYIYTVNSFRSDMIESGHYPFLQESEKVKRLKYNPHGLNSYMNYNTTLGLFCCNPNNIQRMLFNQLDKECGVEEGTFQKGYITTSTYDPIFQLITRGKIRNFDDLEEITCIVTDYKAAEYLVNTWFKGAKVIWDYAVEVKESKGGRPKKFQKIFEMDSKESKDYHRYFTKQGYDVKNLTPSNKEHYKIVEDWINEKRSKKTT